MGAATVELTNANFEAQVKKGGILFIDFWAEWCGPCRAFAPVYDAAAQKHADIVFGKVNTDQQQELAQAFDIRGIPTLAVFRDSILLFAEAGAIPGHALDQLIEKVRGLDMEQVRKDIAAIEAKQKAGDKS